MSESNLHEAAEPAREHETSHVEQATIDVSQARIIQSPQSRQQARYLAYAVIVLFIFTIAIGISNLLFTNSQVSTVRSTQSEASQNTIALQRQNDPLQATIARQEQQIRADCHFDADLAGLPIASGPNGKPSELGVKIISDSRATFRGHGCPGSLPPPDPSYLAGAKLYGLPAN